MYLKRVPRKCSHKVPKEKVTCRRSCWYKKHGLDPLLAACNKEMEKTPLPNDTFLDSMLTNKELFVTKLLCKSDRKNNIWDFHNPKHTFHIKEGLVCYKYPPQWEKEETIFLVKQLATGQRNISLLTRSLTLHKRCFIEVHDRCLIMCMLSMMGLEPVSMLHWCGKDHINTMGVKFGEIWMEQCKPCCLACCEFFSVEPAICGKPELKCHAMAECKI